MNHEEGGNVDARPSLPSSSTPENQNFPPPKATTTMTTSKRPFQPNQRSTDYIAWYNQSRPYKALRFTIGQRTPARDAENVENAQPPPPPLPRPTPSSLPFKKRHKQWKLDSTIHQNDVIIMDTNKDAPHGAVTAIEAKDTSACTPMPHQGISHNIFPMQASVATTSVKTSHLYHRQSPINTTAESFAVTYDLDALLERFFTPTTAPSASLRGLSAHGGWKQQRLVLGKPTSRNLFKFTPSKHNSMSDTRRTLPSSNEAADTVWETVPEHSLETKLLLLGAPHTSLPANVHHVATQSTTPNENKPTRTKAGTTTKKAAKTSRNATTTTPTTSYCFSHNPVVRRAVTNLLHQADLMNNHVKLHHLVVSWIRSATLDRVIVEAAQSFCFPILLPPPGAKKGGGYRAMMIRGSHGYAGHAWDFGHVRRQVIRTLRALAAHPVRRTQFCHYPHVFRCPDGPWRAVYYHHEGRSRGFFIGFQTKAQLLPSLCRMQADEAIQAARNKAVLRTPAEERLAQWPIYFAHPDGSYHRQLAENVVGVELLQEIGW